MMLRMGGDAQHRRSIRQIVPILSKSFCWSSLVASCLGNRLFFPFLPSSLCLCDFVAVLLSPFPFSPFAHLTPAPHPAHRNNLPVLFTQTGGQWILYNGRVGCREKVRTAVRKAQR